MASKKRIKCAGCGRRIPDSVPDVMVRKLDQEHKRRFYHQKPTCMGAAKALLLSDPTVWRITFRHIDPEAN
jgi:hypothetical protein